MSAARKPRSIESIEGKRGNPRVKPPFPGVVGRVEQAHHRQQRRVPGHRARPSSCNGSEWYKAKGTEDARGTKIFQVVGHVKKPGIVEANLGMTVRELIDKYGGGVRDGHKYKSCQTGGASFGFFKDEHLDTPMEYKAMAHGRRRPGLRHHAGDGRHHLHHRRGQVDPLLLPARVLRLLPALPPGHPGPVRADQQGGRGQRRPRPTWTG